MKLRIIEKTENGETWYFVEKEYTTFFGKKKWTRVSYNEFGDNYVVFNKYKSIEGAENLIEEIKKYHSPVIEKIIKEYEV